MLFTLLLSCCLFCITCNVSIAQNSNQLIFNYSDSVNVINLDNDTLLFPWLGGMNAMQIAELDLNLDGVDDVILFDRIGDKVLPFIKKSVSSLDNVKDFYKSLSFAPDYVDLLPEINNWIICKDFNDDGMNDIFTYTIGGIKVFQNVSSDGKLMFDQITEPFLRSFYNEINTNILATSVDYPGIFDIDDDGDLDIFVFGALGAYVEFHKNMSVEWSYPADSLCFVKMTSCWGRFAESEESNQITLNTCQNGDKVYMNEMVSAADRHTGSTFSFFDANGDGAYDLLLGDVDYANPCLLLNSSNVDAEIVDFTFNYPEKTPIDIFSFPIPIFIDVDGDGTDELFVSSFDPDPAKADGYNSSWLYRNSQSNDKPDFNLLTDSFLQEETLDFGTGAFPLLHDFNDDGLQDLFISNYGYCDSCFYVNGVLNCDFSAKIALLQNVGSNKNPIFKLVDDDFANISDFNLRSVVPAFFDFDNDGDYDLFCGCEDGKIYLFENRSNVFVLIDSDWLNLSSYDLENIAPCFYDVDNDGFVDLIIGNHTGKLSYFKNDNGNFVFVDDMFGGVDVRDYDYSWTGNSVVSAFSYNDTTFLSVGAEGGRVHIYKVYDENISGDFELTYSMNDLGFRVAPAIGYLKDDVMPNMIVGNFSGGVQFFSASKAPDVGLEDYMDPDNFVDVFPNPSSDGRISFRLNGVDVAELYVYSMTGKPMGIFALKEGENNLNLSSLNNGVYIFSVDCVKGVFNGKFLIIK